MKMTRFWLLCAVFTMGGVSAWAGPVARIGETDYATLDEAVAAGGKIQLLSDVALDSLLVPSDAEVTLVAIASQLTKVAETKPLRQTAITLPAEALTVGLYYWIEDCSEVGGEWRQIGCQMATGNALTYYLFGSDGQSRYFRVGQSLCWR